MVAVPSVMTLLTIRGMKNSDWFGVTYKEDKPQLMAKIEELIEAGVYPRNLWE